MAAHAIVVAYPGQGHINPMMQLATKIASEGITVTFVLTQFWHKSITQSPDNAFTRAQSLGLPIRSALIPNCVVGESQRWGNMAAFFLSLANMEAHVNQLISNFSETPVTCMVADAFLKWAPPFAKRLGLPLVSLWPMSVTTFSIFYHSDLVRLEGRTDCIPGVPSLQRADLPSPLKPPFSVSNEVAECIVNAREADWIVANSFYGLEYRAVEALRQKMETPVQCVGPLLPLPYFDHRDRPDLTLGTGSRIETDCSQWLGSKPPRSVIYVSFGSFIPVSRPQILEIALGLMESGCHFVWALRPDKEASHFSEMLPAGYLEESKGVGVVAPWFSQVEVLNHVSVGGFLSHCGWNAVMEGVLSGVPMLGFPLTIDQFPNCKMVADEWKFGMRLGSQDDENSLITGEEIAKKVKMLMEGEEGVKAREAAERFRDLARGEMIDGGLSAINLKAVVDRLKEGALKK